MTHDATHATNLAGGLKGADLRTLTRIWQHPLTLNLALRDVIRLFTAIERAETQHNGDIRLRIGNETLTLQRSHGKDLTSDEVITIRHFLDRTGWSPTAPQLAPVTILAADMVVIIDRAGARVHRLGSADDPHHILHDIDAAQHDSDREGIWPADQRFFADIASALTPTGRIVVIGHGKGQSNAAQHLIAWADSHRPDIHARIARNIVADLPNMTTGELLALARHALANPAVQATPKSASS